MRSLSRGTESLIFHSPHYKSLDKPCLNYVEADPQGHTGRSYLQNPYQRTPFNPHSYSIVKGMLPETARMQSRKRGRESNDDFALEGFQEHRSKRRVTSLPLRRSPELKRRFLPASQTSFTAPQSPSVADITPAGSDSEDIVLNEEPPSSFSPWSSPTQNPVQCSDSSSITDSSQSSQMVCSQANSEDLDMMDSGLPYPGPFQPGLINSIVGRIPTPIYSQFSSHIRSGDNGADRTPTRNSRRLPSPISEDEAASPSALLQGLGCVQMDTDDPVDTLMEEPKAPPKKGHARSKHSLRNWGGIGSELPGVGVRRGFSMGYRSDCEKCRMKVPGHFSHIITY